MKIKKKNPLMSALSSLGQKCLDFWKVNHSAHFILQETLL